VEQPLVHRFCEFLTAGGFASERVRYDLDGAQYLTDIVVRSAGVLIEAKYHTGRPSIRMAVGQIKDYDFMEHEANQRGFAVLALLLGDRPTESALRYAQREGIDVAWTAGDGWAATETLRARLHRCAWS
jgi:hypothetical protein